MLCKHGPHALLSAVPHLLCAAETMYGIARLHLQLPCATTYLLCAAWQVCIICCPSPAVCCWDAAWHHRNPSAAPMHYLSPAGRLQGRSALTATPQLPCPGGMVHIIMSHCCSSTSYGNLGDHLFDSLSLFYFVLRALPSCHDLPDVCCMADSRPPSLGHLGAQGAGQELPGRAGLQEAWVRPAWQCHHPQQGSLPPMQTAWSLLMCLAASSMQSLCVHPCNLAHTQFWAGHRPNGAPWS